MFYLPFRHKVIKIQTTLVQIYLILRLLSLGWQSMIKYALSIAKTTVFQLLSKPQAKTS